MSETQEPIITLRDVTKAYKTAAGDFLALKGVSTAIYPGEFVGILGKSGAGKTTLVNLITGIDRLTGGEIWVNGTAVNRLDENRAAEWRGKALGVVLQSFQLMPSLSLLDNVMLPVDFAGRFHPIKSPAQALSLLEAVELKEHAYKLPSEISGGQQQRVAIARALANDPPILVADEPTGRLDSVTAEVILRIFEDLARQGKTILMVSHDPSFVGRYGRVLWLADGQFTTEPQFELL